jgi:DNA-binding PadR family transcriptional regulator
MPDYDLLQNCITDLRRGTLVLAALSRLAEPKYGYALLQDMEAHGIRIEANTLYPLLRRLESQGLLESEWDTAESRPRKYYTLNERGHALYAELRKEWQRMAAEMENLMGKDAPPWKN